MYEFWNPTFSLPKLTCSVASGLDFSVAVYNWFLPDDHVIYNLNLILVNYYTNICN